MRAIGKPCISREARASASSLVLVPTVALAESALAEAVGCRTERGDVGSLKIVRDYDGGRMRPRLMFGRDGTVGQSVCQCSPVPGMPHHQSPATRTFRFSTVSWLQVRRTNAPFMSSPTPGLQSQRPVLRCHGGYTHSLQDLPCPYANPWMRFLIHRPKQALYHATRSSSSARSLANILVLRRLQFFKLIWLRQWGFADAASARWALGLAVSAVGTSCSCQ